MSLTWCTRAMSLYLRFCHKTHVVRLMKWKVIFGFKQETNIRLMGCVWDPHPLILYPSSYFNTLKTASHYIIFSSRLILIRKALRTCCHRLPFASRWHTSYDKSSISDNQGMKHGSCFAKLLRVTYAYPYTQHKCCCTITVNALYSTCKVWL